MHVVTGSLGLRDSTAKIHGRASSRAHFVPFEKT
jgi:hypothetical protein